MASHLARENALSGACCHAESKGFPPRPWPPLPFHEHSQRMLTPVAHEPYDGLVTIDRLRARRGEILQLAERHGVRNVRVFGSVARGDDRLDSDVDLLVDVQPGRSLLDVIGFEQDLSDLFERRVEVLTDGGLSPHLERRILQEAASL